MTHEGAPPPPPPPYEPPPSGQAGSDQVGSDRPAFDRKKLIRPLRPRYVAGVSGAFARATNTDPVLWRVLLTVLGLFGGAGVLIYLIGWLAIPAEGDTASPVESLLGRGRSGMKPLSILLLCGATVLTFAFVVNDGFRAALLAVAVLVGAALLVKRNGLSTSRPAQPAMPFPPPPTMPFPPQPTMPFPPQQPPAGDRAAQPAAPPHDPVDPVDPIDPPDPVDPAEPANPADPAAAEPTTAPLPPLPPKPPQFTPPTSGYRPPFAPHGPYAAPAQSAPPAPPAPAATPEPPREKSKLGSMTFFALILVMGFLTVLSLTGVSVPVSAFFAAALATIAAGLIVGAWFGRARGLIALALLATLGLGVSTGLERWGGQIGSNIYRPGTVSQIADRYDFAAGNAVLDLRRVDFAGAAQTTTVEMKLGQIQVLLPPTVDVTADVGMNEGRAVVFGTEYDARQAAAQAFTDQGTDGAGGGTLHLNLVMNTGNVEVVR